MLISSRSLITETGGSQLQRLRDRWVGGTLTLIHYFYPERLVDEGNSAGAAQVKAHAQAKVGTLLQLLDAQLAAHGGPWLLGARYSALDPYAFMLCRWTRGFDHQPAREYPNVAPFPQRLLARPAVQRVFVAEALAQPYV